MAAYFNNMRLAQNRTQSVMLHCLTNLGGRVDPAWSRQRITANGLSSGRNLTNADGKV